MTINKKISWVYNDYAGKWAKKMQSGGDSAHKYLERPAMYRSMISIFIPASTVLMLFSIGLSMKFNKITNYLKAELLISVIKFFIVPLSMVSIGFLLGYHQINDGLPLKVILILSSTPVAFHSLIPPSQYGLNLDLANSCWIFTTISLVIIIPLLIVLIN